MAKGSNPPDGSSLPAFLKPGVVARIESRSRNPDRGAAKEAISSPAMKALVRMAF